MSHKEPKGVLRRGAHDIWHHPIQTSFTLSSIAGATLAAASYLSEVRPAEAGALQDSVDTVHELLENSAGAGLAIGLPWLTFSILYLLVKAGGPGRG